MMNAKTNTDLTLEAVASRVEEIKEVTHDFEVAHSKEDELWADVLKAIAEGAPNAAELAKAALKTQALEFARHCA